MNILTKENLVKLATRVTTCIREQDGKLATFQINSTIMAIEIIADGNKVSTHLVTKDGNRFIDTYLIDFTQGDVFMTSFCDMLEDAVREFNK